MSTRTPTRVDSRPKNAGKRKKNKPKRKKGWRTAATSDIHELYELSVQEPEAECDLIDQAWKELHTRTCRSIREDFCGTAAVCMEWVKRHKDNTSIGVDLDQTVLDWAKSKLATRTNEEQASRVKLLREDVCTVSTELVDCILAMNFSYSIFDTRQALLAYFKHAYQGLVDDGMFLLDAYGGSDSYLEMEEERDLDGFTYVWDQHHYNPITNRVVNHIHFKFPDGTKIKKAFTYEWRLWSLPELQELLKEAGFSNVAVFWEGTDEDTGEGDGEWSITTDGEACPGWVAYLAAVK
jgi:cyclopropane fatty-acyl-phospholipid synthase-like methyltransferase